MFRCLNRSSVLCAALITGTMTYYASADTLIDTGPGPLDGSGLAFFNDPQDLEAGQFQFLAGQFTLENDFTLESAEVWLRLNNGEESGDVTVKLFADDNNELGQLLETNTVTATWTLPVDPSDPFIPTTAWVEADGLGWDYAAGTYWIAFEAIADSNAQGAALFGAPSPLDNYAISNGLGLSADYNTNPSTWGLRLSGSEVPEPSSLALLGLGGALFMRRRRNGGTA